MPSAEWVTAITTIVYTLATIGLLIAATIAGVFARRAWQEQRRANDLHNAQSDSARDLIRRTQAEKVSAWVAKSESHSSYDIHIRNGSEAPIYRLAVRVHGYGENVVKNVAELERGLFAPSSESRIIGEVRRFRADETRGPAVVYGEVDTRGHQADDFTVEVCFMDAAGVRWRRSESGKLEEL